MMDVGMLWLDDDRKRPFAEKVRRAAEYYENKYGRFPTTCMVHCDMSAHLDMGAKEKSVDKITILPTLTVLPHHFWLGIVE